MKVKLLCFSIAGFLFLSGCAVRFDDYTVLKPRKNKSVEVIEENVEADFLTEKKKQLIRAGNTHPFIQGYVDGCSSGKHAIGETNYQARKDLARYKVEREYSMGWERGYYECRDDSINKMQEKVKQEYVPIADPVEEQKRTTIWEDLKK